MQTRFLCYTDQSTRRTLSIVQFDKCQLIFGELNFLHYIHLQLLTSSDKMALFEIEMPGRKFTCDRGKISARSFLYLLTGCLDLALIEGQKKQRLPHAGTTFLDITPIFFCFLTHLEFQASLQIQIKIVVIRIDEP